MIEELKALAEKALAGRVEVIPYGDGDSLVIHEYGTDNRICFMATPSKTGDIRRIEAQADLICLLWNNLPAILSALEAVPVMKEALGQIEADCEADYPPSHGAIKYACRQALAALEGK